jgi:hypothetical protein
VPKRSSTLSEVSEHAIDGFDQPAAAVAVAGLTVMVVATSAMAPQPLT